MRSNIDWIRWGNQDPRWAAASWKGKQKTGSHPWTDAEFYSCGEDECETYLRAWSHHGLDGHRSCLELGCGPGRLTAWLARRFHLVHGVDVSPGMIETARRNISAQNVLFHLNDGVSLPLSDSSVDAVLSTWVFQHFEQPRDGLDYFREIQRVLAPGGVVMVHLPVYQWPAAASAGTPSWMEMVALEAIHNSRMAISRVLAGIRRWRGQAVVRGIWYDAQELFCVLTRLGFQDIEVCALGPGGLSWVFCRKAALQPDSVIRSGGRGSGVTLEYTTDGYNPGPINGGSS